MTNQTLHNRKPATNLALACLTAASIWWGAENFVLAQTQPANLSPDLQQVVKLAQARMGDDVIESYIKNTGKSYQLGADDLVYLTSQGVSQAVISALQATATATPVEAAPAPAAAAAPEPPPMETAAPSPPADQPAAAAATPAVSLDSFQNQLTPYGNWIQTPDGPIWQPTVPAGWRPYYDGGHWVNTDAGWYWQSDYTWGDIAFHYGRWSYSGSYGWVWTPGLEYAPAWVAWRHADDEGYCGWAPLPPGTVFIDGRWRYHDVYVADDFDFGLSVGFYTFVDYGHFWEPNYRLYIVPHDRLDFIYRKSVFANHYRYEHGRYFNEGLDRGRMGRLTGREVRMENAHDLRAREEHDHVAQRENDRATIRSGGKIGAGAKMESTGRTEVAGKRETGGASRPPTAGTSAASHGASSGGALAMPGSHTAGSSTGGAAGESSRGGALGTPRPASGANEPRVATPARTSSASKKKPN